MKIGQQIWKMDQQKHIMCGIFVTFPWFDQMHKIIPLTANYLLAYNLIMATTNDAINVTDEELFPLRMSCQCLTSALGQGFQIWLSQYKNAFPAWKTNLCQVKAVKWIAYWILPIRPKKPCGSRWTCARDPLRTWLLEYEKWFQTSPMTATKQWVWTMWAAA